MTPGKAPPLSPADVALGLIRDLCHALLHQGTPSDGNWGHPSAHSEFARIGFSAQKELCAAPAEGAPTPDIKVLVDRFLAWPLPNSVRSDLCVTMDYAFPRSGTNLLGADEARQMLEYLFAAPQGAAGGEAGRMKPVAIRLGSGAQPSELYAPQDGAPPAVPGPREDASRVPPMRMLAGLLDCAKCGYSVVPNEILDAERKHFWNHAYQCVRCLYQSAGGATWGEAVIEWNRRSGTPGVFISAEDWRDFTISVGVCTLSAVKDAALELIAAVNKAAPQASGEKE